MFDLFAPSHLIILLAVALVVVGPKDLPKLMHMAGKWAGKARNLAGEFKKSFDDMARQTELDELRKEIEELRNSQTVSDVETALNQPVDPLIQSLNDGIGTGPEPRSGEMQVTGTQMPEHTGTGIGPMPPMPETAPKTAP